MEEEEKNASLKTYIVSLCINDKLRLIFNVFKDTFVQSQPTLRISQGTSNIAKL